MFGKDAFADIHSIICCLVRRNLTSVAVIIAVFSGLPFHYVTSSALSLEIAMWPKVAAKSRNTYLLLVEPY